MREFAGRANDSGQIVTNVAIPFSELKGGRVQNRHNTWSTLVVPTGEDQFVLTAEGYSFKADIEKFLRKVPRCHQGSRDSSNLKAAVVRVLIKKLDEGTINPYGPEGKETYKRMVGFIIEYAAIQNAGCRICPACLAETPTVFAICLSCRGELISHGLVPFGVNETTQEDEGGTNTAEKEVDEAIDKLLKKNEKDLRKTKQESVDRAVQEAVIRRRLRLQFRGSRLRPRR